MKAFFNLQLKIYFRHASSYVVPLIFGIFFIIINVVLKWSASSPKVFETLLYSVDFLTNINHFSIFMIFIVATFVCQTVFYKYKSEGVDYILYSKPLSRTQIYFANIFVSAIGLLFSIAIIELGYFISRLVYPTIIWKEVWGASGAHLLAITLTALFALGIASLVHSSVGLRMFQILIGAIPFLITIIFGVVKFAWSADNIKSLAKSTNNVITILPSKEKGNKKFLEDLKGKFNENQPILMSRYNDDLKNVLLNITDDSEDITKYIDNTHKSVYNYLYWLNIENYFSLQSGCFDHRINSFNKKINYYKVNPLKSDGTIDYQMYEKYGYHLDNNIKLNIWNVVYQDNNKNSIKEVKSKNLFGVSYDANSIENKLSKGYLTKEDLYESLYKTYKEETIEPMIDKLKLFESIFLDKLYENIQDIKFNKLPYVIDYECKKVLVLSKVFQDFSKILSYVEEHQKDKYKNLKIKKHIATHYPQWIDFFEQFNDEKVAKLDEFFVTVAELLTIQPKKPKSNSIGKRIRYEKKLKIYQEKLEENKKLFKKAGYLMILMYGLNKEQYVLSYQASPDNLDELNELDNAGGIELLKLTPLERDLIVVTRKDHMTVGGSIILSMLAAFAMMAGGWAIFIRKNFK